MNRQGRPTEPVQALSVAPETFTGNHALRIEEALIFETGRTDVTGVDLLNSTLFNEFTIRVRGNAAEVVEKLAQRGILGGVPASRLDPSRPELFDLIIVAATEVNTGEDRAAYARALREVLA